MCLLAIWAAVAVTGEECFTPQPSDLPYCGGFVTYPLPLSMKNEMAKREDLAANPEPILVCKEFFGLPSFQCFKNFPACKGDGTPKLTCASVCKTAHDRQFEACTGIAKGSSVNANGDNFTSTYATPFAPINSLLIASTLSTLAASALAFPSGLLIVTLS